MEKTWKIELSGFADEINPQLDEQIRVLKKLGMHYVEMRGANGKGLVEYPLDEVEKIKEQLDENSSLMILPDSSSRVLLSWITVSNTAGRTYW